MSDVFIPIKTANLEWRQDVLFSLDYHETYYSVAEGFDQRRSVFFDGNNLSERWQALPSYQPCFFTVGETGFGTGLNFLMTWHLWTRYSPTSASLHYISCEKHPLKLSDLSKALAYWPQFKDEAAQLIAQYPVLTPGYHQLSFADGRIRLTLMLGDALDCFEQLLVCGEPLLEAKLRTRCIDAWYLDGFSPDKNKDMWSESLISVISMLSQKGTTLATYAAADKIYGTLKHSGFILNKQQGLRLKLQQSNAHFTQSSYHRLRDRQTPWHTSLAIKERSQSAIIIGAGLAGSFTAYSLAKRGWRVLLIDESAQAGQGGSGNQQALLSPKLSAYSSPLNQLMMDCYLYAQPLYKEIVLKGGFGELNGSLLLASTNKEQQTLDRLSTWLLAYPELGELVDAKRASELAGLTIQDPGLYIPGSGWINSPALCQYLIAHDLISLITDTFVSEINCVEGGHWQVNDYSAPVLILANGSSVHHFSQTQYLPIKPFKGQMTKITATRTSDLLKIPLSAQGHVGPAVAGIHHTGATYELNAAISDLLNSDDQKNLAQLSLIAPNIPWSQEIRGHWSGIRASVPDYLPLVGPIMHQQSFLHTFAGLRSNSKRWIPQVAPAYSGLYICAGFGSRGLTTVPLCAEWLASFINNEISPLPRNLVQAISPARFLRKSIIGLV